MLREGVVTYIKYICNRGRGSGEPCTLTAKLKENFCEPSKSQKNPVSSGTSKGSAHFP